MQSTHYVFFSRSNAAKDAMRRGIRAFETMPIKLDPNAWTYEVRKDGPGIDYALEWAAGKDWVHHVELTALQIPVLVVTCFREEITEDIPKLFELRPLTPSLWEKGGERSPRPRSILPRGGAQDASEGADGQSPVSARPRSSSPTGTREKSTAESPVKIVWAVCEEKNGDRKAIIDECVSRGVHPSTAATQYSRWKRSKNAS